MATLGEIEFALKTLYESNLKKEKISVLHCNTAYPTPMADVNLKAINTIKKYLSMVKGIKAVLSKTEIINSTSDDPVSIRLKNMIHEQKSADVFVLHCYCYC